MNWIFSFIILLAICQCSVAKKHKSRSGDKNAVTQESTMAPVKEKKQPAVEKKHHHHHKERSHHLKDDKHRFEIERSHDKEKKKKHERKGKERKEEERKEKERREEERKEKERREEERKEKERKEERKEKERKEEERKETERKEEERRDEIKELVRKEEERMQNEIKEKLRKKQEEEEEKQSTNIARESHDTYRVQDSSESNNDNEKTWKFDVDVPEILRSINNYTGISISDAKIPKTGLRASDDPGIFGQKIRIEVKPPSKKVMGFLQTLLRSANAISRRDYFPNRWVEEQPGEIKSDTHVYPADQEAGQLYALLELKKKRDRQRAEEKARLEEEEENLN